MGDGSLSQDEIDALLQGTDDVLSTPGAAAPMEAAAPRSAAPHMQRGAAHHDCLGSPHEHNYRCGSWIVGTPGT